jgi:hypothetical protein
MTLHVIQSAISKILILSLASLLSLQCFKQPLEPVMPNWDIQFSIPLADTTRTLLEIVNRDTSILQVRPTEGNLIYYNFREFIGTDTVGNRMKLFPASSRFKVNIGTLRVDSVQVGSSVDSLVPPGTYPNFPGMSVSLPAFSSTIPQVTSLRFASGVAELTVTNNLPVGLTFTDTIRLTDGMGRVVARFDMGGTIDTGSSRTAIDSLAGRTMDSSITVSNTALLDSIQMSLGSSSDSVTFTPQSGVGFVLRLRDLLVDSATAYIPSQRVFSRDSVEFQADVEDSLGRSTMVESAVFKAGNFTIDLMNHLGLEVRARLRLPQLRRIANNAVFDSAVFLLPSQSASIPIDLTQYRAISLDGLPTNKLWYTAELDSVQGNPATFTRNDSLTAEIIIDSGTVFILQYANVVIEPTPLNVDTTYGLKLGDLPGNFSLDSLFLPRAAFIMDSLRTPVDARIDTPLLAQVKDTAGMISVDTVRYRGAPFLFQPPVSQIPLRIDSTNSNIIQVMSQFVAQQPSGAKRLPDSVHVKGSATLNPNYSTTPRIIADTTRIKGRFDVEFPLNIGLKNGIYRDSVDITGKIGIDPPDIERFNRGTLTIEVGNSLPASLKLDLSLRQDTLVWPLPQLPSDSIFIAAAPVDPVTRFSAGTVQRFISLNLDRDDIRRLADAQFLRFAIRVNAGSPGSQQSVKFRTTDSVRLRISGTLIFHVSF